MLCNLQTEKQSNPEALCTSLICTVQKVQRMNLQDNVMPEVALQTFNLAEPLVKDHVFSV